MTSIYAGTLIEVPTVDPRWGLHEPRPLHAAVKGNDLLELSRLLDLGVYPIDERDRGETALHLAMEECNTRAALLLLDKGADIKATNPDGWTALHTAAQSESTDAVALLLGRGADVNAQTKIAATALHMAAFNGRLGATKFLVLGSADMMVTDGDGWSCLDNARYRGQSCPCTSDQPDREWGAVIAFLSRIGQMAAKEQRAFAERSCDLHVAALLQAASEQGDVSELSRLLDCYAGQADARDHDGSTALHAAAEGGNSAALGMLLDRRANANLVTNCGDTALHFAAREGQLHACQLLVARGADVHSVARSGAAAVDYARKRVAREWEATAIFLEVAARETGPKGAQLLAIRELIRV